MVVKERWNQAERGSLNLDSVIEPWRFEATFFALVVSPLPSPLKTAKVEVFLLANKITVIVAVTFSETLFIRLSERYRLNGTMSSSATKAQSQKIFEKLKTKPANKVYHHQVPDLH